MGSLANVFYGKFAENSQKLLQKFTYVLLASEKGAESLGKIHGNSPPPPRKKYVIASGKGSEMMWKFAKISHLKGGYPRRRRGEHGCREDVCKENGEGAYISFSGPKFPPTQRARGSKKFILARTHEKTIPPRTKFSFSLEIFILGLKFSFSIENFNPRPCFLRPERGPE